MAPNNKNNASGKGLSYVAATPSFLKNFGKPPSPPPVTSDGRASIPERPTDGKWARGSDHGGDDDLEGEEEDEWDAKFGGGDDDGPQVVVLREGRHLTADQVKLERRKASGKKSESPTPTPADPVASSKSTVNTTSNLTQQQSKSRIITTVPPTKSNQKRKLVGAAAGDDDLDNDKNSGTKIGKSDGSKKKKKKGKVTLSFNEAEGEE